MDLTLNSIETRPLTNEITIYSRNETTADSRTAYRGAFNRPEEAIPADRESVIWSLTGKKEAAITLDYQNNFNITKLYYSNLLLNHLGKSKSLIMSDGFIGELYIYQKEDRSSSDIYSLCDQFRLRFHYDFDSRVYNLIVIYGGKSLLSTQPLGNYDTIPTESIARVLYKNQVIKYGHLSEEKKKDIGNIYPIINRTISTYINIDFYQALKKKRGNSYLNYFNQINTFSKRFLFGKSIGAKYEILDNGFLKVREDQIKRTSRGSNLLAFGKKQTSFNVYNGLKQYGPLYVPDTSNLRYLFLFHKDDNSLANQLFSYFNKGLKGFPGLQSFIGLPFNMETVDRNNSIKFSGEYPSSEIAASVKNLSLDPKLNYIAIYLSRISKDDPDQGRIEEYFKIKEILLKRNISSQVVHTEKIQSPAFNYFLPNIAIALLAKAGGRPWLLAGPVHQDLIVGIGARKSKMGTYIGNAICFANDGSFEEFDAFSSNGISSLGDAFKQSIKNFVASTSQKDVERLVVHFYKEMSSKEAKNLERVLSSLEINIPYVVLSITESTSNEFVVFDDSFEGKMPVSGHFIKIANRDYLLCNNTRYEERTATKIDEYPLPIRIKISQSRGLDSNHPKLIMDLIDQVALLHEILVRVLK